MSENKKFYKVDVKVTLDYDNCFVAKAYDEDDAEYLVGSSRNSLIHNECAEDTYYEYYPVEISEEEAKELMNRYGQFEMIEEC